MRGEPRRRRGSTASPDAGMVTVEFALGLLAVAVVIALALGVLAAGSTRAALCQAVREVAREASVGAQDPGDAASRSFGSGAHVAVSREGRWIRVEGTAQLGGPASWAGARATCSVTTLLEDPVP